MSKKLFALCALSLMAALAWGQSPVVKVEGGLVQGVASTSSDVTGRPVLTTVFRRTKRF